MEIISLPLVQIILDGFDTLLKQLIESEIQVLRSMSQSNQIPALDIEAA